MQPHAYINAGSHWQACQLARDLTDPQHACEVVYRHGTWVVAITLTRTEVER